LIETVRSRARLIEAVARFDATYSATDLPGGPEAATLSQVVRAHGQFRGFGRTGEFTLARRDGDNIVFLLRHRHADLDSPKPIPFDSELAEPMRRALSGGSGTVIGLDYRGEKVLAAYEQVGVVNWGVVGKIDLAEIRGVFLRAGLTAFSVGLVVVLIGAFMFLRRTDPLIRRLASNEARTRAILDTAADGVITIDEQGTIESFNAAAERIFGYAADEATGKNVSILMPAPHQEHHTEYLDRYLRTGQARLVGKTVELTGKRREGTMFPLEATVSEVRLPGRRLFTGIFRDITERKRADEALRLDEARLEALVKLNDMAEAPFRQVADFALEEAVRVTTSKMGFLGFMSDDESVMTIHAWSTGAMQECAIGEKPKVFAIADAGLWGEVIRQRQPIVVNDYLGMKIWKQGFPEGHAQIWRFLGVPLFDGKRIVAVAAVANKQDDYEDADIRQLTLLITGVWRVLQRQRAREALRTSEERFRTVAEFASDCIYWRSPDGDVLYVSPGCAELTGYTPEEFCASPRLFDTVVHPEDRALWEQHEHAALADDSPQTLEFRIVTKTGELRWVSHVCRPIHDAAGRFLGVRGSNRDITERRRLEEEILEISRREEQRIGQDLHDVVGQRLTGIAFLIKALQRRLAEQTLPEASAAAEIASMASETIIETRTLAKGLCPVDLTADGLMTALQEHAANVEELYDIVCTFKCDRPVLVHEGAVATHLYRIAQEAVNNATKHAQAQRIEITIAADDERRVTLTVRDDGVGLPDDFDRTDGMGLRIMNYRARMIGATLDVSRNRGGGTTVVCSLQSDDVVGGAEISDDHRTAGHACQPHD
jgi:PAS domain S-box-containing protein